MTFEQRSLSVLLSLGIAASSVFGASSGVHKPSSKNLKKLHSHIVAAGLTPKKLPELTYYAKIQRNVTVPDDASSSSAVPLLQFTSPDPVETKASFDFFDPLPVPSAKAQQTAAGPEILIQSDKFDPDLRGTAASHMKALSVLAAFREMDKNPDFKHQWDPICNCDNWELARRAFISSDNIAVQILVAKIAPVHTDEGVRLFLNDLGQDIGLSKKFRAENASGNPDYHPKSNGRADSYSTPNDEEIIGFELAKHKEKLREMAWSVGTVKTDKPTTGFFYPMQTRGDPPNDGVVFVDKTGTDRANFRREDGSLNAQNHSALCILITPDTVIVGYHRHPKYDPRSPFVATAQFTLEAMRKAGIENTHLQSHLEDVASGRKPGNDVGVNPNTIGKLRIYKFHAAPRRDADIQLASANVPNQPGKVVRAHRNHQRRPAQS